MVSPLLYFPFLDTDSSFPFSSAFLFFFFLLETSAGFSSSDSLFAANFLGAGVDAVLGFWAFRVVFSSSSLLSSEELSFFSAFLGCLAAGFGASSSLESSELLSVVFLAGVDFADVGVFTTGFLAGASSELSSSELLSFLALATDFCCVATSFFFDGGSSSDESSELLSAFFLEGEILTAVTLAVGLGASSSEESSSELLSVFFFWQHRFTNFCNRFCLLLRTII
jgi:hypothetical protein